MNDHAVRAHLRREFHREPEIFHRLAPDERVGVRQRPYFRVPPGHTHRDGAEAVHTADPDCAFLHAAEHAVGQIPPEIVAQFDGAESKLADFIHQCRAIVMPPPVPPGR